MDDGIVRLRPTLSPKIRPATHFVWSVLPASHFQIWPAAYVFHKKIFFLIILGHI